MPSRAGLQPSPSRATPELSSGSERGGARATCPPSDDTAAVTICRRLGAAPPSLHCRLATPAAMRSSSPLLTTILARTPPSPPRDTTVTPPPLWSACGRRGLPERKKQPCMLAGDGRHVGTLVCGEVTGRPCMAQFVRAYIYINVVRTYRSSVDEHGGVRLFFGGCRTSWFSWSWSWSRGTIGRSAAWFVSWLWGLRMKQVRGSNEAFGSATHDMTDACMAQWFLYVMPRQVVGAVLAQWFACVAAPRANWWW